MDPGGTLPKPAGRVLRFCDEDPSTQHERANEHFEDNDHDHRRCGGRGVFLRLSAFSPAPPDARGEV